MIVIIKVCRLIFPFLQFSGTYAHVQDMACVWAMANMEAIHRATLRSRHPVFPTLYCASCMRPSEARHKCYRHIYHADHWIHAVHIRHSTPYLGYEAARTTIHVPPCRSRPTHTRNPWALSLGATALIFHILRLKTRHVYNYVVLEHNGVNGHFELVQRVAFVSTNVSSATHMLAHGDADTEAWKRGEDSEAKPWKGMVSL